MSDSEASWLLAPDPPTRQTWDRLRRTTGSLMRELMNLEISRHHAVGRTLDVGGGSAAMYSNLLSVDDLYSVNIDADIEPSVVADLGASLPFASESFDTVISFNTLEHLADDRFALREMVRVLKPGGQLWILVPFLFRVHGHPEDFHRHTAAGWNQMLNAAGVPSENQQIKPLVWDPFSTAWAIADIASLGRFWWRARRFLRPVVLRRPLHMCPVDRRQVDDAARIISDHALAYSIRAVKPGTA